MITKKVLKGCIYDEIGKNSSDKTAPPIPFPDCEVFFFSTQNALSADSLLAFVQLQSVAMDDYSELIELLKSTEGLISQFAETPLINKDAIQRQTHVIQANLSSIRGLMRNMEAYIEELDRFVLD